MNKRYWFKLLVLCLVLVIPCTPLEARRTSTTKTYPTDAPTLLQFTSNGQVLGFAPDAVYVADGRHAYRVEFVGGAAVVPVANSSAGDGRRAVPLSRVTYPDLWPGVTLTYDAPAGAILRSTYRLAPFADPAAIRLRYNVPPQIESDGTLALTYETGVMRESAPLAWQEINSVRVPVRVAFSIRNREVGFAVGEYNPAYPLFIDPTLTWNTFLGASIWVMGDAITVDGYGYVYVVGTSNVTWGTPVRAHSGKYSAFVAKLDSSGTLLWNTFLGGSGGDYGRAIAVDSSGNIYVTGESNVAWQGANPPVRAYMGSYDAFVAKLNSSGVLLWNTFLGGSGLDMGAAIAVDSSNVYVAGRSRATWGTPVRAYSGHDDAFVAHLNDNGTLLWNTFLGGSWDDWGEGIATGGGKVWVAGSSDASWQGTSAPIRSYSDRRDVFAASLNGANGALLWNTFLGGSGDDYRGDITVWGGSSIYIAGFGDASWGSPVRPYSGDVDVFVARLDSNGGLTWNTFLGGNGYDDCEGIAVDGSNNVYVVGDGKAWGSPVRAHSGLIDAFVARLNSSGGLTWNTFLGGSALDYGRAIAVDSSSNVHVAGGSYATWGSPVRAYTAGYNAFASRLNSSGGLNWNTFLGGVAADAAYAIAADWSSNVYVAGYSDASWGTPARGYTGGMDAFVAKLDSNGTLIWDAFLGGSGDDLGHDIAVDGSGNVYVVGISYATWQGTSPPVRAFQGNADAFVAALDSNGGLVWNTFLGGSGFDRGFSIAWDGSNGLYVAGDSDVSWQGTTPPTRSYTGSGDAFAAKLNKNTGTLVWNTFLGGNSGDEGRAIAVDWSGLYVAGTSNATWQGTSAPKRPYQGNSDAFSAKLDKVTGTLVWNTFLGGNQADWGYAIVGSGGDIYVAGHSIATWGAPVRDYASGMDAFVAKLDNTGNLTWNTFLGGDGDDYGYALTVDEHGDAYVAGESSTSWGAPERSYSAAKDAFAAKLNDSSGALTWNTFLGGNGDDEGYGVVVDESGRVFVAGRSNENWGAPLRDHNGDRDAFIAFLSYCIFLPVVVR